MIRRATLADVTTIVALGRAFLESPDYQAAIVPNEPAMLTLARSFVELPDRAGWIAEQAGVAIGMMLMVAFEHPMSAKRVAGEVAWWVDPAHRGTIGPRLLRIAEAWARDQEATALFMIAPNAKVAEFYERTGFTLVEMTYQRSLT